MSKANMLKIIIIVIIIIAINKFVCGNKKETIIESKQNIQRLKEIHGKTELKAFNGKFVIRSKIEIKDTPFDGIKMYIATDIMYPTSLTIPDFVYVEKVEYTKQNKDKIMKKEFEKAKQWLKETLEYKNNERK